MIEKISIKKDSHTISGILTLPDNYSTNTPVVIMCHGTGSDKNEVGNGYVKLADLMANKNIGSLRFDFIGTGESDQDYRYYSFKTAVNDVESVIKYLNNKKFTRLGIMGWSQGGSISLLSSKLYDFNAMVLWAAALNMNSIISDEEFNIAKENGYVKKEMGWRSPLNFGYEWMCDVRNTDLLKDFREVNIPTLAINGEKDDVVLPSNAIEIGNNSKHIDSSYFILENADHAFGLLSNDEPKFEELCDITIEYFIKHFNK